MKVKLRKLKKKKNHEYLEIRKLTEPDIKSRYNIAVRNRYEILQEDHIGEVDDDVNELWTAIQTTLLESAKEILPKRERTTKQQWMTRDILLLMEERRKHKRNDEEYNRLDRQIRRECIKAKEKWINEKC